MNLLVSVIVLLCKTNEKQQNISALFSSAPYLIFLVFKFLRMIMLMMLFDELMKHDALLVITNVDTSFSVKATLLFVFICI